MRKLLLSLWLIVTTISANEIYATFDVEALRSANVAFSASGIVDKIYVDVGSIVKKGDNLANLQNKDLKAMLNIYKTNLKFAKKDYKRQLKIKNIIDQAKFDKYANGYESAKARVEYQKALLDKTTLKAPFDAMIISKEIESGDVVSGQVVKTAFKVQSIEKRKLILQFDQKYHNSVKVGDIYKYKLDGDKNEYQGIISKVYPSSNSKTRKIKAEVMTKNLTVGLFGDGYITTNK